MTPQTLNLIGTGFYVVSTICFIIGIYFFFSLHIVEVFNDLTGRSVKKQLQRIQTQPQSQAMKPNIPSAMPSPSKKNTAKPEVLVSDDREFQLDAGMYQEQGSEPTDILYPDSALTTPLANAETTVLDSEATTILSRSQFSSDTLETSIHMIKREVVIHTEIDQKLIEMETDS